MRKQLPKKWLWAIYWMDKLCDCESILYLLNFSNDAVNFKVLETPFCKASLQVPYIPDPFGIHEKAKGLEVFECMLQYIVKSGKDGGK